MTQVYTKNCREYNKDLIKNKIIDIFEQSDFLAELESYDSILLKPNLLGGYAPEKAVTSHPVFIAALVEILYDYNIKVSLFDNPGGSSKFRKVIKETGIKELAEEYNITILDPNSGVNRYDTDPEYIVSKHFLDCEAIINLSKMKTHSYTLFTGAIKNMYGIVPGMAKSNYHRLAPNPTKFAHFVVDLYEIVKNQIAYNLMDGILGMDGDGPSRGNANNFGVILGSKDGVALDFAASRMMGYKAKKIPVTKFAAEISNLNFDEIKVLGDFDDDFRLKNVDTKTSVRMNVILRALSAPLKNFVKKFFWTKPVFDADKCVRCSQCVDFCPAAALELPENSSVPILDEEKCILCLCCIETCPENAVKLKKSLLGKILIR